MQLLSFEKQTVLGLFRFESTMPVGREREGSHPHQLSKNKFCSCITKEWLKGIALTPPPFL